MPRLGTGGGLDVYEYDGPPIDWWNEPIERRSRMGPTAISKEDATLWQWLLRQEGYISGREAARALEPMISFSTVRHTLSRWAKTGLLQRTPTAPMLFRRQPAEQLTEETLELAGRLGESIKWFGLKSE